MHYYRIVLHVTKVASTQFNGLMIYIYDLIDYHIYKLLNQTYALLLNFGVDIRDSLDKSFCRVTYTTP